MAKIHGKSAYIAINSTALQADANSITINIGVDTGETTAFGEAWDTFVEGNANWTVDADFFYNAASSQADPVLFGLIGGGSKTIEIGPEGNSTGQTKYSGSVILTSMSPSVPVGEAATISASFQGTGALTRGTF